MRIPQRVEPLSMFNINCGNLALRLLILKIVNGEGAPIGKVAFHAVHIARIEPPICQKGDTSLNSLRKCRSGPQSGEQVPAIGAAVVEEKYVPLNAC